MRSQELQWRILKMAKLFNEIKIEGYRGLKNVELLHLGDVNIILGSNNSGKTSICEAIQFFRQCSVLNFQKILYKRFNRRPSLNDYVFAFPIGKKEINISADILGEKTDLKIKFAQRDVIFDKPKFLGGSDLYKEYLAEIIDHLDVNGKEIKQLDLKYVLGGKEQEVSMNYVDAMLSIPFSKPTKNLKRIQYVAPYDHFKSSVEILRDALRSDTYSKMVVSVLQAIDENIEDIGIMPTKEESREFDLYIKQKGMERMPLALFGDGIKKALTLAASIAAAKDGALIIDEIETSLHYSFFYDIFKFLLRASKHFKVQLFITTHSQETINTFLELRDTFDDENYMNLYTLRKNSNSVYCRRLTAPEATQAIDDVGLEVRD